MKFNLSAVFILAFFFISLGKNRELLIDFNPPDSSSSLIDKTAATYFIDEGKKMLNEGRTREALAKFRQAYVKDQYNGKAAYWIGYTHYRLANYGFALKYARIAETLTEGEDGDVYLLLGESYHRQNILDSAELNYNLALTHLRPARITAFNVQQKLNEVQVAKNYANFNKQYNRNLVSGDLNSGYNDYAPFLNPINGDFYFVSRRPDTKGGGVNPDDQAYFEDIYVAKWNSTTEGWDSISNELGRLNTDGFDAISHLTSDGNRMYITLNTSVLDTKKPTRSSDICTADFTSKGTWNSAKPIKNKTINTSFFDGAATVTEDENTMYFVSDRKGEKSKSDIYVVEKVGKNWGEAVPLPMHVNSIENETTPYITPDGRFLFYSSDGLNGMGGYDIYVVEKKANGEWGNPINLGPEFNSVNHDTHFKYFMNQSKGYMSSYQGQGDRASMDMYEIILEGWTIPTE